MVKPVAKHYVIRLATITLYAFEHQKQATYFSVGWYSNRRSIQLENIAHIILRPAQSAPFQAACRNPIFENGFRRNEAPWTKSVQRSRAEHEFTCRSLSPLSFICIMVGAHLQTVPVVRGEASPLWWLVVWRDGRGGLCCGLLQIEGDRV